MPKRITGVSARLLDCAKEEFLNKGFQNASIRDIAEKADTSPRAVYTRFPDKEGLFTAIVEPVADEFLKFFQDFGNDFWDEQSKKTSVPEFSFDSIKIYLQMIDFAYDHVDEFKLILKCSEGTRYSDFIEQLTITNCKHVEKYNKEKGIYVSNFETMMKLLHMLTHSFYAGLFEPLLHDISREEAHFYVEKLCEFFSYGISGIM
ncbi:TetR/AcrR family transcriptional regulator [Oscillospiraceae bacterium PP1C4]